MVQACTGVIRRRGQGLGSQECPVECTQQDAGTNKICHSAERFEHNKRNREPAGPPGWSAAIASTCSWL